MAVTKVESAIKSIIIYMYVYAFKTDVLILIGIFVM